MNKKHLITGMLAIGAAVAATSAQASVIQVGGITFDVSKVADTVGSGTQKYDIWDVTVTALTGSDATAGQNGQGISSLSGTWAVTGTPGATNAFLTPGGSTTAVKNNILEGSDGSSAANGATNDNYTGVTYLNMDTWVSFTRSAGSQSPTSTTNHSTYSTGFTGNAGILGGVYIGPDTFTGGAPGAAGADNPLLAEIIVTHGSNWTYNGSFTTAGGHVNSGATLTSVSQSNPASISLSSSGTATATIGVVNHNNIPNAYFVNSVATVNSTGTTVAISDIKNEAGSLLVYVDFAQGSDVSGILADLNGNGWTATAGPVSNPAVPGTWDAVLTTANPTTANGNDFLTFSLGSHTGSITSIAAVPEPTTLGLMGLGLIAAASRRRRNA